MSAYGAEIVLTPASKGMKGAIEKAEAMVKENKDAATLAQFENPDNPKIHYETTAVEILDDLEGRLDVFVAGVGTGGTLSGTAHKLKEVLPDLHVAAVEPESSPVISGRRAGDT